MKINNIILFGLLATLLVACSKDFNEVTSYEGDDAFYFGSESTTVLENVGEVVSIPVVFTTKNGGSGTVSFSSSSDELTEGVDYNVLTTGPLSFDIDNDFTSSIMVELIDNEEFTGGAKPITFTLSSPSSGDVGFSGPDNLRSSTTLLVQDDDCPSRDIAGSYTTNTTGTSTDGCCPDPVTVSDVVSIVDNGDDTYTIFDWSVGLYGAWYDIYGVTPDFVAAGNLNGIVSVICDEISGSFGEPFGQNVDLNGTIDLDTGVITYTWINGFDDTATVTLTPQ